MHTVINAIQFCFGKEFSYQCLNILPELFSRMLQLFGIMLCQIHKAFKIQIKKFQSDSDPLYGRKNIVKAHYLVGKKLRHFFKMLHLLRNPRMVFREAFYSEKVLPISKRIFHHSRMSDKCIVHNLHDIGLNFLKKLFMAFYCSFLCSLITGLGKLLLFREKMMPESCRYFLHLFPGKCHFN